MKKVLLVLVAIAIATPAMAGVTLTATATGLTATVGYSWDGTGSKPRAFALTVTASAGTITTVTPFKVGASTAGAPGYGIFPGSIVIDGTGNVTSYGTPVEPATLPGASGTGLGTNKVVLALGSLYAASVPGDAPLASAPNLFTVTGTAAATLTISAEVTYRGGVVGEDAANISVIDKTVAIANPACLTVGRTFQKGLVVTQTMVNTWNTLGQPSCWCCEAQKYGNADYTGTSVDKVDNKDLNALKKAYGYYAGDTAYIACADFDLSGKVDNKDLNILKANYGTYPGACN